MFDVAYAEAGAKIAMATSSDEQFPPENIIDGKSQTFWVTTGLYPQEFVVTFVAEMSIQSIQLACYNVKKLSIFSSNRGDASEFEKIAEKELDHVEGHLQMEEFPLHDVTSQHLKVTISSGYDHFVSVHKLNVTGSATRG